MLGHHGVDGRSIGQVALDKNSIGVDGLPMALIEVVEHDNRLASRYKLFDDDASDVTSATGNQDSHSHSLADR
jgi:hypothetical protein